METWRHGLVVPSLDLRHIDIEDMDMETWRHGDIESRLVVPSLDLRHIDIEDMDIDIETWRHRVIDSWSPRSTCVI